MLLVGCTLGMGSTSLDTWKVPPCVTAGACLLKLLCVLVSDLRLLLLYRGGATILLLQAHGESGLATSPMDLLLYTAEGILLQYETLVER